MASIATDQTDGGGTPRVILPNLHWHYTGVTATARSLAPRIAAAFPTAWFGPCLPGDVRPLGLAEAMRLWRAGSPTVWHARRNNEMLAGLVLKLLGWPLRLAFTRAGQRKLSWITEALIKRMDTVIATTAASAAFIRGSIPVIHHGVDTSIYHPPEDREAAWAEARLPGRIGIGCFGRVRPQKGTDVFVEAMCRILPDHPEASAVIVGQITTDQRPFAKGLMERIRAAGLSDRIVILGEVPLDEVVRWYRRIAIYAFTPRIEGFGLTLLEAMASGNATIATPAGAAPLLIQDGENGLVVPTGDVEALAGAVKRLLGSPDLINALGAKAREYVISSFSIEQEARALIQLYDDLLRR